MDFLSGGDLRFHINTHRKFSEDQTKFFVVCLLSAFECFHKKNIIHRDIKPENIVLDDRGYLRVTDFGIARY
jgi:serine/threonine protein kinase